MRETRTLSQRVFTDRALRLPKLAERESSNGRTSTRTRVGAAPAGGTTDDDGFLGQIADAHERRRYTDINPAGEPRALPRGRPPRADALTHLGGIAADPRHAGLITAQQAGQGMDARKPTQGLHARAQDSLDARAPRAVEGGAGGLLPPRHHAAGLQEVPAVLQPRPCIPSLHPIDQWLAGHAAGHPGIVAPSDLPTPALRQVLRDLVVCVPQGPPSAVAGVPAREESGPPIKACAYIGTSGKVNPEVPT